MKKLQSLPVYPLHQFFFDLSKLNRVLFIGLFLTILGLSAGILFTHENPVDYAVDVKEISTSQTHPVTLETIETNYREFDVDASITTHETWFVASAIISHKEYTIAFMIVLAFGFSFLLAAATGITGFWSYPVLFVFIMFLYLSEAASEIWGQEQDVWKVLPLIAAFIVPAYLFQQKIIRLNLALRFTVFFVLHVVLYFLVWRESDWLGWHRMASQGFTVLSFVVIGFLFFIGKDIVNMLMIATTNLKNPKKRFRVAQIAIAFVSIFAIQLLLLQEYADLDWVEDLNLGLRPMHFILVASVVTVATSQNIYPAIKSRFHGKASFTFLIGSFVIISLASILYYSLQGEELWVRIVERHGMINITVVGLLFFAYILYNFRDLIQQQVNVYFLLMMPKRMMYIVVVFFSIIGVVAFEAKDQKKTLKVRSSIYENLVGDYWTQNALKRNQEAAILLQTNNYDESKLVKSEADEWYKTATLAYENALNFSATNPKSHYNYATLLLAGDAGSKGRAFEHLRISQQYKPFAYAALNHGFARKESDLEEKAMQIYLDYLAKQKNKYVLNNLAMLYADANDPDSALINLKEALRLDDKMSSVYSNMALIYHEHEKKKEAKDFFQASIETKEPSSTAIANAFAYNLLSNDTLNIPAGVRDFARGSNDNRVTYNLVLSDYIKGNRDKAQQMVKQRLAESDNPDLMVLDILHKFKANQIELGISQAKGLEINFPEYAGVANHLVGIMYYQNGVPEMAFEFFRKAADAGIEEDHLNALRTRLDLGWHEDAFLEMQPLRILYEDNDELYNELRKESAMLSAAHGDYIGSMTEWDFEDITPNQRALISLYAGAAGKTEIALENFRTMILEDSSTIIPYLEMGRIYIDINDDRALEDLPYGLTFEPNNIPLKIELARAQMKMGNMSRGLEITEELMSKDSSNYDIQILQAEADLYSRDTALALTRLIRLNKKNPINKKVLELMADTYVKLLVRKEYNETIDELLYNSKELNNNNPKVWYALAILYREIDFISESGFCATEAIRCTKEVRRQTELLEEFSEEIQLYQEEIE